MKKIIKKLKGKKVLSLVLAAIMIATTFNIALPMLKLDASAAGSITTQDGTETVNQTAVVTDTSVYEKYAADFLSGASRSTGIVVPGMAESEDYVVQGITYYPKRDWMLVTAYHADSAESGTVKSSKVFALDAATGDFVAMFSFLNPDGTTANTDHGGGIAVSEYNIYYACGDTDRKIAYAPLSALENAELGKHTVIQLVAEKEFTEVGSVDNGGKTAYTAYVCYDEGILWTGNFFDAGAALIPGADWATIAKDYNVAANKDFNSMIFGYELKGGSSAEEWANLTATTGEDRQGNPSYAIGLNNAIKDVQYATVDNGKLYLSCSFGTGEGTLSVSIGGMNPYSSLIVADIDLSIPGTDTVTISTNSGDKQINAYRIDVYKQYDMMPMSEGLCVIEDKIYVTFEGASNKYLRNAGVMGNCGHPVDVIWELDPYALMEIEKAEPENSIYYEKVNSNTDIKDGKEYIIVYESDAKDPTTQQNILYAFDADGNFEGHKLSKSTVDSLKGYDGMVGHPITEYSILKAGEKDTLGNTYQRDILYLDNKEKDDIESIRWTISNISDTKYNIRNTDTYFADCNNFYFDANRITMLPSSATTLLNKIDIGQLAAGNGYFYFSNNNAYLWCNDGLDADRNAKINAFYSANYSTFSGLTETPGTIHCDAVNVSGENILGGTVSQEEAGKDYDYPDGAFQMYRRVTDNASSTYESRVFTDLNAELQADGTYTIDLETYAISPNHYQYVGERPTDYILVMDASSSMNNTDSTGIITYAAGNTLSVASFCYDTDINDDRGENIVNGYGFSKADEEIYWKHTDGNYYQVKVAVHTYNLESSITFWKKSDQRFWAYYIADDGKYYVLKEGSGIYEGVDETTFKSNVQNGLNYSKIATDGTAGARVKTGITNDEHYRFTTNTGQDTRIQTFKTVANDLVDDIAAQNPNNRIALVKYGADTSSGFYNTSSAFKQNDDYANAFFSASQKDTVKALVNGLTTTQQTNNSGIEMDYANAIISNSGKDYTATGDTNVVVIFMSDGIPGADDNSTTASAANAVINKALTAKKNGAFIYSVMTGQATGFDKKTYMEAVSTKYAAATGMNSLGGQSIDGVNYFTNLSSCSVKTYLDFGALTTKEVEINTAVGLANLDANAILRQELSDSFIIPEGTQPVAKFIKGEFDAIGRFAFDEDNPLDATGVTVTTDDDAAGNITIKGYNYATQYIAKGKTGYKLRVRLEGVLADKTKTIHNTPISNTDTTALYQNSTQMANGVMFKQLPTSYLNIPTYTYVLDYGVNMLDQDVNGTMLALDEGPYAQPKNSDNSYDYRDKSQSGLIEKTNSNQDLIYKMTPTSTGDEGYVLIDREDGSYDWFKLKVVPASNVLYEESSMTMKDDENVVAWTHEGTATSQKQDISNDGDVYGYDSNYANSTGFSNGTHYYATVDSDTRFSDTASVTFKGTGVDLLSACGPNTGVQLVTIKKDGNFLKGFVVDTYYKDTSVLAEDALLHQVPIVKWTGEYGTYTVETKAYYLSGAGAIKNRSSSAIVNSLIDTGLVMNSAEFDGNAEIAKIIESEGWDKDDVELIWFDDNSVLNGGTGVAPTRTGARSGDGTSVTLDNYIDGFRVYNPVEDTSSYIESEQSPVYYNVIDELVAGDTITSSGIGDGIAYITGSLTSTDEDGNKVTETLSFSNYENFGPTDELYLKGGATNGITFNTPVEDGGRVMVSLRAVNGASTTTTAKINGTEFAINSATEMYYDITDLLTVTEGKANVTIINSGSGILAVNNIKLTNTASGASLMMLSMDDMETVQYYAAMEPVQATVKNGVVTPVVEEEEIPEDNTNTDTDTDTETEETEKEEFSLFSLIELLIVFIEKILRSAFGAGNIF